MMTVMTAQWFSGICLVTSFFKSAKILSACHKSFILQVLPFPPRELFTDLSICFYISDCGEKPLWELGLQEDMGVSCPVTRREISPVLYKTLFLKGTPC